MENRTALEILTKLKSEGGLFISLTPPFSVSLEADRQSLTRLLGEHGEEETAFKQSSSEIAAILSTILDGTIETFVERQLENLDIDSTDEAEAERDRWQEEIKNVQEGLYDENLQKRYELKRSSKAPSFNQVDWDIKVKHFDAKVDNFQSFPYATFRIEVQRSFEDTPFTFFGGRTFESVQVNIVKDEIDYFIRVLATARGRLEELEGKV